MSDKNSFEEQRRRKAANFHLMIQDNYDDEGSDAVESEPAELNSYTAVRTSRLRSSANRATPSKRK